MSFKQQAGGVTGVVMVMAMMMTLNSGTYTQVHTLRYTISGTHSQVHTLRYTLRYTWYNWIGTPPGPLKRALGPLSWLS